MGYDDSQWLESLASVSTPFIYGETTQLPDYGYGYRSIYFRRNFVVSDISGIAQLTLRIDYDDGFVAYLNGKEIVRRGVSGEADQPVAYHAYATYHPRGFTEEIDISGAVTNLLAGTNVLAIQLQGSSTNDFTACMVAELMANFTALPPRAKYDHKLYVHRLKKHFPPRHHLSSSARTLRRSVGSIWALRIQTTLRSFLNYWRTRFTFI